MRLAINGDGDCTGTFWMVCSLVWVAQAPGRLEHVAHRLEAAKKDGAYSGLSRTEKAYVKKTVPYVHHLQDKRRPLSVIGDPELHRAYAGVWCSRWGRCRLGIRISGQITQNTRYLS